MKHTAVVSALKAEKNALTSALAKIDLALAALCDSQDAPPPAKAKKQNAKPKVAQKSHRAQYNTIKPTLVSLLSTGPCELGELIRGAHQSILSQYGKRVPLRKIRKAIWGLCYDRTALRVDNGIATIITLVQKEK